MSTGEKQQGQNSFFEKINKIDKSLGGLTKKRKRKLKVQILGIKKETSCR